MDARRNWIICILLFLALGVTGLTVRPLVVPDEPRYGIIPAEMVDTGNWLALRMAGFVTRDQRRVEAKKPGRKKARKKKTKPYR